MAPFSHDDNEAGGPLWNINTLNFNFAFVSNLNRMWSHDDAGGSIITQMNTTINTLELLMTFMTPPPNLIIPPICTTTYSFFNVFSKTVNSGAMMNPNQEFTQFTSDVFQLSNIPQSMYIFAKVDNNYVLSSSNGSGSQPAITIPDTFCQLGRISIRYKNRTAILNNATSEQLYDICVNNGYNRDYQNFRGLINSTMNVGSEIGLTGSVYRFIFGKDIAFDDVIPGIGGPDGRTDCQISIDIKNINQTTAYPITLYIVLLSEGVLQIVPQQAIQTIAPINSSDEVHMAPVVGLPYRSYKEMIGGGFWDTLKGIGKTAMDVAIPLAMNAAAQMAGPQMVAPQMVAPQTVAPKVAASGGRRGGILASGGRSIGGTQLRMIKQKLY